YGTIETVHLMETVMDFDKPNYIVRVVISTRYWPAVRNNPEAKACEICYETRKLSYKGETVLVATSLKGENYQNLRYEVYAKHYEACKDSFG
ncbi:MAG: hypothetical protein K8F30_02845, partial [Taibaiella sp.]|nr:hypothetical protein [Taibaiella sp.]